MIHLVQYREFQMAPLCQTEQCFPSVILKLIHRQFFFQNLKSFAAPYYGIYCIDLSEHCAVRGPSDGHNAKTDERRCVISVVTTLTGNPLQNTHS